jgi:hypothetical protein
VADDDSPSSMTVRERRIANSRFREEEGVADDYF